MSTWRCTICGKSIEGSLDVVLALAREHEHMERPPLTNADTNVTWWTYPTFTAPIDCTSTEAQTEIPCERCCA